MESEVDAGTSEASELPNKASADQKDASNEQKNYNSNTETTIYTRLLQERENTL